MNQAIKRLKNNSDASISKLVLDVKQLDDEIESLGYENKSKALDYDFFESGEPYRCKPGEGQN